MSVCRLLKGLKEVLNGYKEAEPAKVRAQGATSLEVIIQKRERVSCVLWKQDSVLSLYFSDDFPHDFYPQNIKFG